MSASIWNPGADTVPTTPAVTPFQFIPGTVTVPGITFVGDTNTGIWSSTPGALDITADGVNVATLDSIGLTLGAGKKLSLAAEVDVVRAATTDIGSAASNLVRITGGGYISSLGTNYRGPIFIRFAAITSFVHSASLQCPGGVDLVNCATDTFVMAVPKCTAGVFDGWAIYMHDQGLAPKYNSVLSYGSVYIGAVALGSTYKLRVEGATSADIGSFYQVSPTLDLKVYFDQASLSGNGYIARKNPSTSNGAFAIVNTSNYPFEIWTNNTLRYSVDGNTGAFAMRSAGSSLGYSTGSGGTVAQATSKATGVTLNTGAGQITLNAANLAAATAVSFVLTNSVIAANDTVVVSIKSGATLGAYHVMADAVTAGTATISLRNLTAGALAEAVVLNFAVVKGSAS